MSLFKRDKCYMCRKKTLISTTCKCKNNYCFECLPYFNHNCKYNWITDKQNDLTKENPQIIRKKIETI